MPRKPNYNFEKHQKEAAKQKKKAEKRQRKQDKKAETPAPGESNQDLPPTAGQSG